VNRSCRSEGVAVILLAVALACAGSTKSTGPVPVPDGAGAAPQASPFPSAGELENLADRPAPEILRALDAVEVDAWELAGPFPERLEVVPSSGGSPWDLLLADEARRRPGLLLPTEAMNCVARELGRFFLAHGAKPGKSLLRYIASVRPWGLPSAFRTTSPTTSHGGVTS